MSENLQGGTKMVRQMAGVVVLSGIAALACAAGHGPDVGKPAPQLIGKTLDGETYILKRDNGSPKVINFFWVNCRPCRQEMPELAKLEARYPGVKFISVHTEPEDPEKVAGFLKSLPGAPSNIVLSSGGLQADFSYTGLPHTMVLDSDNVVLMNLEGYDPANPGNMRRLKKQLEQLTRK